MCVRATSSPSVSTLHKEFSTIPDRTCSEAWPPLGAALILALMSLGSYSWDATVADLRIAANPGGEIRGRLIP